ncbi:N-acetyltransferase family protein [Plantactinospora sp. CA-290183]|uniref:GNAT family N-acetyltransferase n=1 Tax=Plantactinospora sp. CA-290183 TaxID=3240006 RepID=UPI003D8BC57B
MTTDAPGAADTVEIIALSGVAVLVRTAHSDDLAAVNDLHGRCSPQSRRARYHGPRDALRTTEWRRLVDPARAWSVLLAAADEPDRAIGFASLIRLPDPDSTEASLLIEDRWQGFGIGTAVAGHLTTVAKRSGAPALTSWIGPANVRALRIAHRLGADVRVADGVAEARLVLQPRVIAVPPYEPTAVSYLPACRGTTRSSW